LTIHLSVDSPTDDSQTEPESDFIDDDSTEPETQCSERISPSVSKGCPKINVSHGGDAVPWLIISFQELLYGALMSLSKEHSPCSVNGVHGEHDCTAGLHLALDIWRNALQEPSSAPPRIAYRLDRRDPKEPKSLPYTPDELLTQTLDPNHVTVLNHLKTPATSLGFELYLANATMEIAGSGNAYDPHIPLDDIEMLSWPKPKVALTFSHWAKVGAGPVEAPRFEFEFEDDQWIPNPPPDDDSFFTKEYDWDLRPVSHMHDITSCISNYNLGPWRAARMFVTCLFTFRDAHTLQCTSSRLS